MRYADPARASRSAAFRIALVAAAIFLGFAAIIGQLTRLAFQAQTSGQLASISPPLAESYSRPDIRDRDNNVLAKDILLPSVTADPSKVLDIDEVVETLRPVLPPADSARLRQNLENKERRFIWVSRKVSTRLAQTIHDFGLPGIGYRWETKRTYPAGSLAGHAIGAVDGKSAGIRGLERYLDVEVGLGLGVTGHNIRQPPLRVTLSMSAQHALEAELKAAMDEFGATGATGLVMDADTGEIAAAASLPQVDPAFPERWIDSGPIDRLTRGTYELGSVFKIVTAAMGLEHGVVTPRTLVDVGTPIQIGRFTIKAKYPRGTKMPVQEVVVRSVNIGTANIARQVGAKRQRAFLARMRLLAPMETETGPVKSPIWPKPWRPGSVVTISYGHGIAVAPIQFASAAATLVNGGYATTPTFLQRPPVPAEARKRILSEATSIAIRKMMRAVVADPKGTAAAADVPGYSVGGKTGTADRADRNSGYSGDSVITSFIGAFPIEAPRFVVLVTLHDPKAGEGTESRVAALNAAPTAGRVIRRVAPILGIYPVSQQTALSR